MTLFWCSWRTGVGSCPGLHHVTGTNQDPCQLVGPERRAAAEAACHRLTTAPFAACHEHVDPGPAYGACLADVCSCRTPLASCLCPILAAYGDRCRAKVCIFISTIQYLVQCTYCMYFVN